VCSLEAKRRAVFLDRDGTIADETGYVNHPSRFNIFPFAAPAIRRLNEAGIPVMVVTNQSGVARGIFPEEMVDRVHEKMAAQLAAGGAHVDGIYYCPHIREDDCACRKPNPGMLERAAREHGLELQGSVMVGDRYDDLVGGQKAGCGTILVMTGYGRGEYESQREKWPRPPDHIAEDLTAAVETILKELR
jgi:D-glycero-D-manno-heptose 1,7-bisphosphate phosphatase